ncbi:hypothetical protein ES703_35188 [subsurface metagenome]
MDFLEDLRKILINFFERNGLKYTKSAEAHDLAIEFFNIQLKFIYPVHRKVHISKKIPEVHLPPEYRTILYQIKEEFEIGCDVNPHLSTRIENAKRKDFLLYDWAIYHLHLSNKKKNKKDYFYKRSGFLLFILVTNSDVYFIDIQKHNEKDVWTKRDYIRIIKENWPELLERHELKGFRLERTFSNEQIQQLREAGVTVITEVDGKIYAPPGGGITTAGTNIKHTFQADDLFIRIGRAKEWIELNTKELLKDIEQKTGKKVTSPDSHLTIENNWFCIKELSSGYIINLY